MPPMGSVPPPPPGSPPPPPPSSLTPPPGYVAYGGGNYGGFSPFDRVKGLAKWISILLVVTVIGQLISIVVMFGLVDNAQAFLDGEISNTEFSNDYLAVGFVSILSSIGSIALVVLTMIWMFRLASNHRKLGRQGTWGPGWAIGGWFLPPMLFVIPFLMFRMLWKGSDPESGPNDPRWESSRVGPIVTIWWVLYGLIPLLLIPVGISTAFGNFGGSTEDVAEQLADSMSLNIVSTVVSIGAAVAFHFLVQQLTSRQTTLTREA